MVIGVGAKVAFKNVFGAVLTKWGQMTLFWVVS